MTPSLKSQEIANAFQRYHKGTGKKSEVESYKISDIEIALRENHLDHVHPYYQTMQEWRQNLKEKEQERENRKRDRNNQLLGFILGIFSTIITGLILDYLTKNNSS